MSAILFGSIGTIADTSELQRQAFNQAFKVHGLDWYWNREGYLTMLEKAGVRSELLSMQVLLVKLLMLRQFIGQSQNFFRKVWLNPKYLPRFGVVETMQDAKSKGLKIALVTTTSRENVSLLIEALRPTVQATDFDVIVDASSVEHPKPDKAAYTFALEKLGEKPEDCIAIEDNLGGVESAIAAGLCCVAFPGENTAHHDFEKAAHRVDRLDFDALRKFLLSE